MTGVRGIGWLLACAAGFVLGCGSEPGRPQDEATVPPVAYTEDREPCADRDPLRNVYFGDLHIHTGLSHETWILDIRSGPADAYRFARGEPIELPPLDEEGHGTRTLRIDRPLDFAAVTDHGEFLGEVEGCVDPASDVYGSLTCIIYRQENFWSEFLIAYPTAMKDPERSRGLCGVGGEGCLARAREVWQGIQDAVEDAYDRSTSCSFTSFVAYEYTGMPGAANFHRNVVFRNANVPELPVSYFEEPTPEGLWAALERSCLEGIPGCDVIAIPHNPNESNGNKFPLQVSSGLDLEAQRELASLRARIEPLVEIFQHKGDSECMNGLAGVPGPPDELCDFEKIRRPPFKDCEDTPGVMGVVGFGCVSRMDYVRNVLLAGLEEEARTGVNPYKLGIVAATDTHNASPGAVAEDRYIGHWGIKEDTPEERLGPAGVTHRGLPANPGGLTAVWAVENSRDAIFEAFHRRETYGTSGPRIRVRFFGGWEYPEGMCRNPDFVRIGYDRGVPMGGDLPPRPAGAGAPMFAVRATMDDGTPGHPGVALQRIQIIKGWIDGSGRPGLKVFDVAGDPDNRASVDLATCEPVGQGSESLCTVWTDPAFRADQRAVYYARVVENPSCRWSTYECLRLDPGERPDACTDPGIDKMIQERAWTSPIWYRPEETQEGEGS